MDSLEVLFRTFSGCDADFITPLPSSGSNRKYYRIGGGGHTYIGVVGTDVQENRAFLYLARHFRNKELPVPEIIAVKEDETAYIQEDMGDSLLSDLVSEVRKAAWTGESVGKVVKLLCETMELLPKIQFEGAQGLDFGICYPQPAFDRRMIMFDLNYFKYCFLKPSGVEFNEVRLEDEFERFADELLACDNLPQATFLYRDFNARNVMINGGQPYFIDFQGGRKGPVYYDVASFVWQARAEYPEWLKEKMLDSYLGALASYMTVDRRDFDLRLRLFVLFRTLQVLGAYGFRGMVEHKAQFVTSIPPAMKMLRKALEQPFYAYPYLTEVLGELAVLPKFADTGVGDGTLEVKVYSFSYKKGIPEDMSGNGGGYVFDCRSIHNPGRYEEYRRLTGRDEAVIRFLEEDGEITSFLDHVYGVVMPHVETYRKRGFTSLMVSFGCTGGQHRSVYCAEHLARKIAEAYRDVSVRLIHREQKIEEVL